MFARSTCGSLWMEQIFTEACERPSSTRRWLSFQLTLTICWLLAQRPTSTTSTRSFHRSPSWRSRAHFNQEMMETFSTLNARWRSRRTALTFLPVPGTFQNWQNFWKWMVEEAKQFLIMDVCKSTIPKLHQKENISVQRMPDFSDQRWGSASMWVRSVVTYNIQCECWQPTWPNQHTHGHERNQDACELPGLPQGHEVALPEGWDVPDHYAEMVWRAREKRCKALRAGVVQRQWLGLLQGESEECKLRFDFPQLLLDPQSLQIPNFCFFEFNGNWDSCSYGLRVCSLKRSTCSRCYSSLWVTLVAWEIKSMWWWDCGWIQQALSLSLRDGVLERRNAFQSYFCGHNKLRENNVSTLAASRPKRTWLTWMQRLCQRRDANSWWSE